MTDLIQNHDPKRENWFWRVVKTLNGILSPNGGVPKDLRMTFHNKDKTKISLRKMLLWDFDRLIVDHGLCIGRGEKQYDTEKFSWLKV